MAAMGGGIILIGAASFVSVRSAVAMRILLASALLLSIILLVQGDVAFAFTTLFSCLGGLAACFARTAWRRRKWLVGAGASRVHQFSRALISASAVFSGSLLIVAAYQSRNSASSALLLVAVGIAGFLGSAVILQIGVGRTDRLSLLGLGVALLGSAGMALPLETSVLTTLSGDPFDLGVSEPNLPVLLLKLAIISLIVAATLNRFESQAQWKHILEHDANAFLLVDRSGRIVEAYGGYTEITGYSEDEVLGAPVSALLGSTISEDEHQRLMDHFWDSSMLTTVPTRPVELLTKSGEARSVYARLQKIDGPSGVQAAVVVDDATLETDAIEQAKQKTELLSTTLSQMEILATTDSLTGLLNRHGCLATLEDEMARGNFTVMFIDIDKFKSINDGMSHSAGDNVLRQFAERLTEATRSGVDVVSRIGGDEFVVALRTESSSAAEVRSLAERLVATATTAPMDIDGFRLTVTSSVGAASSASLSAEEVLHRAAAALHTAKLESRAGTNSVVVAYDSAIGSSAAERLRAVTNARRAVDEERVTAWYQPIVDLRRRTIVGHEALARMTNADRSVVSAADFLAGAAEAGVMVKVAESVITAAFLQLAQLEPLTHMSINASPDELSDPRFAQLLKTQMDSAQIDPQRVRLEITEAGLFVLQGHAKSALWDLSKEGVQLVLDDFGTGYSSISSLAEHPISGIKLDRSFTSAAAQGIQAMELVAGLAQLGNALGCFLIAEGVETENEARAVLDAGWHFGQGYLFSPAVEVPIESSVTY